MDNLIIQAAAFSAIALVVFGGLTWFFFFSPLKAQAGSQVQARTVSPRITNLLVFLLGSIVLLFTIGGLWDASMHLQTGAVPGVDDFLWPPHLMIYGSFLLAFLIALAAVGTMAVQGWRSGVRDPRRWVRANPGLGAVAAAASYALLSVPGDALWHELFGIDLTAWSPPHLLIALMAAIIAFSGIALWLKKQGIHNRPLLRDGVTILLLALALNLLYIPAVLEWELPSEALSSRPVYLYPLVGGGLALVFLLLARHLTRFRWATTATALLFYAIRLAISLGLSVTGNIAPAFPLFFLIGALLLDFLPWEQIRPTALRILAQAAAFTVGYLPVALILLGQRAELPRIDPGDWLAAAVLTLLLGVLFAPLAAWLGRRLNTVSER